MRRDLVLNVIHTLSFAILKEGRKTMKLNIEFRELLKALNEINVGLTVIPQLIWVFIDLLQVLQNLINSTVEVDDREFI